MVECTTFDYGESVRKSVKQGDYRASVLTGNGGLVSQLLTQAILWDPVAGESQSGIHVTLLGVFE